MKKILLATLLTVCFLSANSFASSDTDQAKTNPEKASAAKITQSTDQSKKGDEYSISNKANKAIKSIQVESGKVYVTTTDGAKHLLKVSKKQLAKFKKSGQTGLQGLTNFINSHHFQSPIAENKSTDTDNSDAATDTDSGK